MDCVRVAVDAMGGDNAPGEIVKGAVLAVSKAEKLKVILVGIQDSVNEELQKYEYDKEKISVVNATEVIGFNEPPAVAVKSKRDSSIVVAMKLVKSGEADAFVSAGSTGAILVGGLGYIGRIKGVERTPLATVIPTEKGGSLLIDCGANVDARASHLVQFAKMGSLYMENICKVTNPKVGIVNIGTEEEKGNSLVKETFPLLKECDGINFCGSIEARDIPKGEFDVIVCEGFVGNVILKLYEGLATTLMKKIKAGMMSTKISTLGALMSKKALKNTLKDFDVSEYGGAPLLGLKSLAVKTHGSSEAIEICNSIIQCVNFVENNINDKIKDCISKEIDK